MGHWEISVKQIMADRTRDFPVRICGCLERIEDARIISNRPQLNLGSYREYLYGRHLRYARVYSTTVHSHNLEHRWANGNWTEARHAKDSTDTARLPIVCFRDGQQGGADSTSRRVHATNLGRDNLPVEGYGEVAAVISAKELCKEVPPPACRPTLSFADLNRSVESRRAAADASAPSATRVAVLPIIFPIDLLPLLFLRIFVVRWTTRDN